MFSVLIFYYLLLSALQHDWPHERIDAGRERGEAPLQILFRPGHVGAPGPGAGVPPQCPKPRAVG